MVSVAGFELLHRHAQEACGVPKIGAALHQPSRASMPKDVRGHLGTKSGSLHRRLEALTHAPDRLAVPLNHRLLGEPLGDPAAHVGKQSGRKFYRRLPLFGLTATGSPAIEHALLEVDVAAAHRWHEGRTADRRRARAGIEADEDESGNVPSDTARRVALSRMTCRARQAAHNSRATSERVTKRGAKHIYAAGEGGALFETETQSLASLARFLDTKSVKELAAGLDRKPPISVRELLGLSDAPIFDWKPIRLLDRVGNSLGSLAIYQVLCVTAFSPAKLVLATEGGVFWSDVPASGQEYRFARAAGNNVPHTRCLGLALASQTPGSNAHVVCSPQGTPGTPDSNGIYSGTWLSGSLVMARSTHVGDFDFVQWNDAVVASSAGNRAVLYASVSASGKATLGLKRAFEKAGFSGPLFKFSDLGHSGQ